MVQKEKKQKEQETEQEEREEGTQEEKEEEVEKGIRNRIKRAEKEKAWMKHTQLWIKQEKMRIGKGRNLERKYNKRR